MWAWLVEGFYPRPQEPTALPGELCGLGEEQLLYPSSWRGNGWLPKSCTPLPAPTTAPALPALVLQGQAGRGPPAPWPFIELLLIPTSCPRPNSGHLPALPLPQGLASSSRPCSRCLGTWVGVQALQQETGIPEKKEGKRQGREEHEVRPCMGQWPSFNHLGKGQREGRLQR